MKKLIVVSIMLALVLGAAIGEIFYERNVFKKMSDDLEITETLIEQAGEHVDKPEIKRQVTVIREYWEGKKTMMMLLGNHNVMRTIGEKLVTLYATVEKDAPQDAYVTVLSLENYIEDIRDDDLPLIPNVF